MTAEPTMAELTDSMKRMLLIRRAEEQVMHFADDFDGLIERYTSGFESVDYLV